MSIEAFLTAREVAIPEVCHRLHDNRRFWGFIEVTSYRKPTRPSNLSADQTLEHRRPHILLAPISPDNIEVEIGQAVNTNDTRTPPASNEERNATGQTALHRAAHEGDTDDCISLVRGGAALDSVDARGWTPLQTADMARMFRTAMALVALGAEYGGWTIFYPKGKRVLSLSRLLAAAELGDEAIIDGALCADTDSASLEKRVKKAITHAKNRGTEGGANGTAGAAFLQKWLESRKLAA